MEKKEILERLEYEHYIFVYKKNGEWYINYRHSEEEKDELRSILYGKLIQDEKNVKAKKGVQKQ